MQSQTPLGSDCATCSFISFEEHRFEDAADKLSMVAATHMNGSAEHEYEWVRDKFIMLILYTQATLWRGNVLSHSTGLCFAGI